MPDAPAVPEAAVRKARKAPRMTYKQEIATIKNLPQIQRLVVIVKIAGVFLVAIGLEGIVTANYLFAIVFIPLGVFVSMFPLKVRTDRCIACLGILAPGQSICPACGAPQM
ncbi:MAG: hypothetical protein A3K68_05810 [Euryarchaeota archaeon RBG_16_68_13]|nr:MAG: hypothetical protein A3K68_05810 [Euryarchaeota archaeon RBG_16_68_13]